MIVIKNILFVCTGNTCRSPMAEAITKDILHAYTDFFVFSRGICVVESTKASNNAILAMKDLNIDLKNHLSKQITKEDILKSDIIITMTRGHKNYLKENYNNILVDKIYTLGEIAHKNNVDIIDPYGCNLLLYKKCADELYNLIKEIDFSKI